MGRDRIGDGSTRNSSCTPFKIIAGEKEEQAKCRADPGAAAHWRESSTGPDSQSTLITKAQTLRQSCNQTQSGALPDRNMVLERT